MRNIVHSFWSVPALNNRMGVDNHLQLVVNVYCNAVSFAYAKAFNNRMVFYGDKYSQDFFKIIPYDAVCDIIPINAQKPFCWAQGKFSALKQMKLGDVHIDGDVFIKSKKCWDLIDSNDWDVIVQSVEEPQLANEYYDYVRKTITGFEFLNNCQSLVGNAYNCGVVGINNPKLKQLYLETYVDAVEKTPMLTQEQALKIWPDLIYEQQFLYQLCQNNKMNVRNLLGVKQQEIYENSLDLDYQHVLGSDKYVKFEFIRNELDYIDKSMRIKLDNEFGISDETFDIPATSIESVYLNCDDEEECNDVFNMCVENHLPENIFKKSKKDNGKIVLEMNDPKYLRAFKTLLNVYYNSKIEEKNNV